jgi:hypothetical protein
MYVQITMSVAGPTPVPFWYPGGNPNQQWPAFWGFGSDGTINAFGDWNLPSPGIETDVIEEDTDSSYFYASTVHHWPDNVNNSQTFGVPGGIGATNTFGMLWVPATPSSQGYVQWYTNGQAEGSQITWNYGDTSAYGLLDQEYLQFYLVTALLNPMTVYSVEAWQGPSGRVLNP